MRPPQNAGEDGPTSRRCRCRSSSFNEAPAERGGRLRHGRARRRAARASMRPPQNAGEDAVDDVRRRLLLDASMRPPQNAGEDVLADLSPRPPDRRFNEAPAERGGRRGDIGGRQVPPHSASMRPPQNAGEDLAIAEGPDSVTWLQ